MLAPQKEPALSEFCEGCIGFGGASDAMDSEAMSDACRNFGTTV